MSEATTPRVSVIVPTYNRAQLLPRALESILGQDFADFELLVIDDGSQDDTAQVLARITDPRLRGLRFERNRGIGAARHEGVARSRGELIAFLDSDDVWKPGKLAKVVGALDRYPQIDLVFSDHEDVNYLRTTRERGFQMVARELQLLTVSPLGPDWWAIEARAADVLIQRNFISTSSTVALRKSVFDRAGNFREDLSGPEDLEMWWRAAVLGMRFAYTTEALVERHKGRSSITFETRGFAPRRLKALDVCEETARRAGRTDLVPGLRQAKADTWSGLIEACAVEGRRGEAWAAFRQRLRYGLSGEALRWLAMGMVGPRTVGLARRVLRR
jgi:glycosyltransferase involved in cell wall biosynthesis